MVFHATFMNGHKQPFYAKNRQEALDHLWSLERQFDSIAELVVYYDPSSDWMFLIEDFTGSPNSETHLYFTGEEALLPARKLRRPKYQYA